MKEKKKLTAALALVASLALQPVARSLLLGESEPRVDRRRPIGRRRLVHPRVPAKTDLITTLRTILRTILLYHNTTNYTTLRSI